MNQDASQAPLMLSVSGMRGLVGRSLTPPVAARYAAAFGQWLKRSSGQSAPHVVLGRDSRPSGPMLEAAAAAGLLAVGCRVTTLGVVSTPAVAIMARHLHAHGGMVITASHNPIPWNGLKALRHDGVAPPADQAAQLIDRFQHDRITFAPVEALHDIERNDHAAAIHVQHVLPHVDVQAIQQAKLKVVVDSVHGAGGSEAALLLRELGVELVHLYGEPTGRFPHAPEPLRENLTALGQAVREHGAAAGFAQDPDADRLAIVDETGAYIGEEMTLALCALHVLSRAHRAPQGESSSPAVTAANLSTSRMLDDLAARFGATVLRTPVGEANVAQAMREHDAEIGGEGNGGVIWAKVIHVRDSLAGIALVLELLAARRQPLSAICNDIPRYAIVKDKAAFEPGMLDNLAERLRKVFPDQHIDTQDGVRLDWPDRWVHVRASNTEPIVRFIAEAADASAAQTLIDQVRGALNLPATQP